MEPLRLLGKTLIDCDNIKVWAGSWGCFAISQLIVIEWLKLIPLFIAAAYTIHKWVRMVRKDDKDEN